MALTEKDEAKIANGAIQILKDPKAFCKGSWFIDRQYAKEDSLAQFYEGGDIEGKPIPHEDRPVDIDPTNSREDFQALRETLEKNNSTLANPNFMVCGQGAIFVSAALQGYSYDDAQEVLAKTQEVVGDIPSFNDEEDTTFGDVRGFLRDGFKSFVKGVKA
jgi:hypothetical protein